ncbi:hypothetical protein SDC9_19985 [bioreactor metagenome]|uniref:NAD-specific glutamate dehydrogenase n=1 Tax=bioreactor metagenome TaxID=1076179 RepID=A0A644U5G5_9ZZZZ
MDCAVAAGQRRLAHRFREGRVGVAGQRDILRRGTEFHRDADLVDQLARRRPDDVAAEDAVGAGIDDQLHEAFRLEHRLCPAVAHEGELADLVGAAFLLQHLFGLADRSDLGGGVDHAGDHVIVHVAMLAGDHLGHRHALVLGLVGEHRADDRVADRVDALHIGRPMRVGLHLAARQHLDAERLEAETRGIGLAAGCDEHHLGLDRGCALVLAQLVGDGVLALALLDTLHRGAEDELQPLLGQNLLEGLGDLAVHAGGDRVEIFDDRHLGAEAGIDRAHLEADDAGADDHHRLRDLRQRERAGRGDDGVLVDLDARERGRFRARGDHDRLGRVHLVAHLHLTRGGDRAPALQVGYLVLLEQELDALGVAVDDVLLVGLHLRPVDLHLGAHEAHLLEVLVHLVQVVRGVQQRLRGDAADVQAGAAKSATALDTGGLEAHLGTADRADIATRAAADHDHIKFCHWSFL